MLVLLPRFYSFRITRNHVCPDAFPTLIRKNHDNQSISRCLSERSERREANNCIVRNAKSLNKYFFPKQKSRSSLEPRKRTLRKVTTGSPPPPDPRKWDLNENPSPKELSGIKTKQLSKPIGH